MSFDSWPVVLRVTASTRTPEHASRDVAKLVKVMVRETDRAGLSFYFPWVDDLRAYRSSLQRPTT